MVSDDRRTVALCIPSLGVGGAEGQVMHLARRLDDRKWRVFLITLSSSSDRAEFGDVGQICIRRKSVGRIAELRDVFVRERVDIVQAYLLGAQFYAFFVRALCPRVKLVAAVRSSLKMGEVAGLSGKISHSLLFKCHGIVDHFVFNSAAAEEAVGGHIPSSKRSVIWNGIDTVRFCSDTGAKRWLREELGLPAESWILGVVANVNRYKGYDTFIRAAEMLAREARNIYFVVVGDYDNALGIRMRAFVDNLSLGPRFRFMGSRSDVQRIMPGFDVFCSASTSEGFSNAIGEAMACEVPCVVTDVGDSSFIIGKTGNVVPANDPEAIAIAVRGMLVQGRENIIELGKVARSRVEREFSVGQMTLAFDSLYEGLLGATNSCVR